MAFCGNCGAEKSDHNSVCPVCGSQYSAEPLITNNLGRQVGTTGDLDIFSQKIKTIADNICAKVVPTVKGAYDRTKEFFVAKYAVANKYILTKIYNTRSENTSTDNSMYLGEIVEDDYVTEDIKPESQTSFKSIQDDSAISYVPFVNENTDGGLYPTVILDDDPEDNYPMVIVESSAHTTKGNTNMLSPTSIEPSINSDEVYVGEDMTSPTYNETPEIVLQSDEFADLLFITRTDEVEITDTTEQCITTDIAEQLPLPLLGKPSESIQSHLAENTTEASFVQPSSMGVMNEESDRLILADSIDLSDTLLETEKTRLSSIASAYADELYKKRGRKIRTASVVLGIVAILSSITIVSGVVFSLLAIVLSIIARIATTAKDNKKKLPADVKVMLKKRGKAGIVLGTIALLLSLIVCLAAFIYFVFYGDVIPTVQDIFDYIFGSGKYYPDAEIFEPIQDFFNSIRAFFGV